MKKELKESVSKWNSDQLPFTMLFSSKYIFENGNSVLADCGFFGSILIETPDNQLYGLLFKTKGYESGLTALKCFVYKYPQNGVLNGTTFFTTDKSFQDDIKKYVH